MTEGPLWVARHLVPGIVTTAEITALAIPVTLIIALAVGLARLSRWRAVSGSARIYSLIFRGTSLLVQLYYFFYVLPLVGVSLAAFPVGVLALGLNGGAYASEVVRGSILSIDRGQWEAASALTLPRWVTLRRIILPQAVGLMLPPFTNQAVDLLKGSALLSLITITDLTERGKILYEGANVTAPTVYVTILVIYFLMAQPLTLTARYLERRRGATRRKA